MPPKMAQGAGEGVMQLAHNWVSWFGVQCAPGVVEAVRTLEQLARQKQLDRTGDLFTELESCVRSLGLVLEELLRQHSDS